jgi:hypothetical protein
MLWVRREAPAPLRRLNVSEDFPGLLDGGLEHAVERLFAARGEVIGTKGKRAGWPRWITVLPTRCNADP